MDYTFSSPSTNITGNSPFFITFKPSNIVLTGNQFLSKIVYQFPDKTVTLVNNFTGTPDSTDCRTDYVYNVPGTASTLTIVVTVYIGPAFGTPTVYTLNVTNTLQYLTTNPTIGSPGPHTFGEVHLLRNRAWGVTNSQMFLLETNNPNYLLINYNG